MRIPVVTGLIDRRILVNYRVDPDVIAALLPPPFRPQLFGGFAVDGHDRKMAKIPPPFDSLRRDGLRNGCGRAQRLR